MSLSDNVKALIFNYFEWIRFRHCKNQCVHLHQDVIADFWLSCAHSYFSIVFFLSYFRAFCIYFRSITNRHKYILKTLYAVVHLIFFSFGYGKYRIFGYFSALSFHPKLNQLQKFLCSPFIPFAANAIIFLSFTLYLSIHWGAYIHFYMPDTLPRSFSSCEWMRSNSGK